MLRHHPKSPPFRTNCWLRPVRNSNGLRMREFLPSPFRHWNLCSFRWGAPAQSSAAPCKDPSQPQTHPKSLWLMKRFIGPSPRAKKRGEWSRPRPDSHLVGWSYSPTWVFYTKCWRSGPRGPKRYFSFVSPLCWPECLSCYCNSKFW